MLRVVCRTLRELWRPFVAAELLFKALAFVLLTPTVGLLFRGFVSFSGRTVLADADIARFLLHPTGWLAVVIVGGAIIGVLALEQSVLMTLSLAWKHNQGLTVLGSFRFVAGKAAGIFRVTWRMVLRVLLLAAPFLAVGGGIFLWLLTEFDINYYLTEKPREYWLAVVLIGSVLTVLAALLIRCIVNWSIAAQLHLFESVPADVCLNTSRQRVYGHRKSIAAWVVTWVVANSAISSVSSLCVLWLGGIVVPLAQGHLWTLVITLGAGLLLWSVINVATNMLAVVSFAVMQGEVYDRFGRTSDFALPSDDSTQPSWLVNWTPARAAAAAVIAVLAAALIGVSAIHSVRLDDDVEITAHRGASGRAPENTMAAVRRAIEDGADWVEIDVQESKDGVVIVAHDSDLKKVSGVGTKIWDATAAELQSIDIGAYFGPEFVGERVPTLADVLAECRGRVGVNIELKYYGHDQDLERKVVELVEQAGMEADVVIMSLEADGIRKIRELRPDWTIGLLTAIAAGDLTRVDADFFAVNTNLAKSSFIRSVHNKGKWVHVWTVNDPFVMSMMISRGADNLITDFPDLARQVLDERAEMTPTARALLELGMLFGAEPEHSTEQ